ncbi:MAG: hypothetical protein H7Y00_04125 [Fimbriimonadaceae bacterium]|nr:hypothetical protein [Chitinophagales bacterium]
MWLFISMNRLHDYKISVGVTYQLAENTISKNRLPDHVDLNVSATGWKLLRALFIERNVELDLRNTEISKIFLPNENVLLFTNDLPSDIAINAITPDTILIDYDEKGSKKIPVVLNSDFTFKENYDIVGEIKIIPDSILIMGPKTILDTYQTWTTEIIHKEDIDKNISGNAALKRADKENISLSAIAIQYQAKVTEYESSNITFDADSYVDEEFVVVQDEIRVYYKFPKDSASQTFQAEFIISEDFRSADEGYREIVMEPLSSFVKIDSILPAIVEIKRK